MRKHPSIVEVIVLGVTASSVLLTGCDKDREEIHYHDDRHPHHQDYDDRHDRHHDHDDRHDHHEDDDDD